MEIPTVGKGEAGRRPLLALCLVSGLFLLAACGPLITPDSGPNSGQFPPEYLLVAWTAELFDGSDDGLSIDMIELTGGGAVDGVRSEGSTVVVVGWAPVTDAGVLRVFGSRGPDATILGVEAQWRPDVASAISAEFMGSGFVIRISDGTFGSGDPLCVVAQTGDEWFLLAGSDTARCGISTGDGT